MLIFDLLTIDEDEEELTRSKPRSKKQSKQSEKEPADSAKATSSTAEANDGERPSSVSRSPSPVERRRSTRTGAPRPKRREVTYESGSLCSTFSSILSSASDCFPLIRDFPLNSKSTIY